jgi:hypothetical protein
MVEQYYHLNPHKVPEDGVDYTGPAVHPKLYEPVDFPPQSKLRGPALDRSFDDQGREPISVILECVLKMGMEQGMRIRATENEARARGHLDKAIEHLENEDMPRGFVAAAIESARGRLSNGQQAEQQ